MSDEIIDRHSDTKRNRRLNKAVSNLEEIVCHHDPETDVPIKNGVWDCLDRLLAETEIEAAAQVAAAYERAADRACERLADSWTWDDADFLACVIADLKRHLAALATDTQADALEQVRSEAERVGYERGARLARNMALIEAAEKAKIHLLGQKKTLSDKVVRSILSLMTPDEQTEAAQDLAFRKAVSS